MSPASDRTSTVSELFDALAHVPSLALIVAGSVIIGGVSPAGVLSVDTKNLAATVLQVAGTMVALALPAGQFAVQMIQTLEGQLKKHFLAGEAGDAASRPARIEGVRLLADDLRSKMLPAWRSAAFALVSLLLSCGAVVAPSTRFMVTRALELQVDRLLTGASLCSLIAAAVWIYPTARHAFGLRYLEEIREGYVRIIENEPKGK